MLTNKDALVYFKIRLNVISEANCPSKERQLQWNATQDFKLFSETVKLHNLEEYFEAIAPNLAQSIVLFTSAIFNLLTPI